MLSNGGSARVAYFSMEIALDSGLATYSGGLGVLAGDFVRAAADASYPMVGITLAYRDGYFRQHLDAGGEQTELPDTWSPEHTLRPAGVWVDVTIEGRTVRVHVWRYDVVGRGGGIVPVYLLDTDVETNDAGARALTRSLYAGDTRYRLAQECVLGIGGAAVLRALGEAPIDSYHMNEGHSALLVLALLEERMHARDATQLDGGDLEAVRAHCLFTTHTAVPAGHDRFPVDLVRDVLGADRLVRLEAVDALAGDELNMTYLALLGSRYVNGVAMIHRDVSSSMFPRYAVHAITNGVHALTWTSAPFAELYDRHFPEWRADNRYLRYAVGISLDEIREAHAYAKAALLGEVERRSGIALDNSVLTIGFARRATAYKRANLVFTDAERLRRIARDAGPLQIVFAGKAHPHDEDGKALIRAIFTAADQLRDALRVVYVEDYDIALARAFTSGADLWLNTPQRPLEASGTSGMKAALNGVPSFSVLDGWWIEGHVEGVTGWSIGAGHDGARDDEDAQSLYATLEHVILPLFYGNPHGYAAVMRSAVALNASFFNTQRMLEQYAANAYAAAARLPDRVLA
jgi:starch phosphorylase